MIIIDFINTKIKMPTLPKREKEKLMNMEVCRQLQSALLIKPFFDCCGGCGVDTSNGESNCMDGYGIWFKFCPFCGKKIIRVKTEYGWTWYEEK
jgi:hypothetical protein